MKRIFGGILFLLILQVFVLAYFAQEASALNQKEEKILEALSQGSKKISQVQ